jgi:hypothetical protein
VINLRKPFPAAVRFVGVGVLIGLLGAGCGEKGAPQYLQALKADPMAGLLVSGTRLASQSEIEALLSGFMDKPRPARVVRTFEILAGNDPEQVLEEARSAAREAGWESADWARGLPGWKDLGYGRASIIVRLDGKNDQLRVVLTYSVTS